MLSRLAVPLRDARNCAAAPPASPGYARRRVNEGSRLTPASPATVATLRHHPTRAARVRERRFARRAAMRAWLASRQGLAVLGLGAIALPAFAATSGEWDRFHIGAAGEESVVIAPMPFEKAGSSFPGSAFYYLDMSPEPQPGIGEGIRSDADIGPRSDVLDPGRPAQPMRLDHSGIDRTRAVDCLTAAVYYEARSEPDIGQRAVAQVVLNRVAHPAYPNTVCGVVYQGSQRRTGCQFTFTCDGSLARRPNPMFWDRARNVALAALGGYVHRPAGLATHYHTVQIYPYWAPSLNYLGTSGAHRFYTFKGRAGQSGTFRFAYLGGEPDAISLKTSPLARESSADLNPAKLQQAYDDGLRQAQSAHGDVLSPTRVAPAPTYTRELQQRGGDTLYRGENLPEASGVKAEYRNSGR